MPLKDIPKKSLLLGLFYMMGGSEMYKFARYSLLALPFALMFRMGWFGEGRNLFPSATELGIWFIIAACFSFLITQAGTVTEKKIFGLLAWICTAIALCMWVVPYEMNAVVKYFLLVTVLVGIIPPITGVHLNRQRPL